MKESDFNHYDYIFGMDEDNISGLKTKSKSNSTAKILLLGDFDPEGDRIIRDPYYVSKFIDLFGVLIKIMQISFSGRWVRRI